MSRDLDPTSVAVGMLGVPMIVGMLIIASVIEGFVTKILWSWYIVTTFHLPALNMAQAVGIGLVATVVCPHGIAPEKAAKYSALTSTVVTPLSVLLIGWIVKFWL